MSLPKVITVCGAEYKRLRGRDGRPLMRWECSFGDGLERHNGLWRYYGYLPARDPDNMLHVVDGAPWSDTPEGALAAAFEHNLKSLDQEVERLKKIAEEHRLDADHFKALCNKQKEES